jgi:hypothetical protein
MKQILSVLFLVSTLRGASMDRWRELVLDEATPADAERQLGKPIGDKLERMPVYPIDRWFSDETKKKSLRRLSYRVDGFKETQLFFRDGKLVGITLILAEQIDPSGLENLYGIKFRPYFSPGAESLTGRLRHSGDVAQFPPFYNLVADGDRAVVNAYVKRSALSTAIGGSQTVGNGYPGRVVSVQLISRSLVNRGGRGAELLQ